MFGSLPCRVSCNHHHEEIRQENPQDILLREDELQHKSDDGKLYESTEDGICHVLLDSKPLVQGQDYGDNDHSEGKRRLDHTFGKVFKNAEDMW